MKLKFKDNNIKKFKTGKFVAVNTGEPFEVADALGQSLLKEKTVVDGVNVPLFEIADAPVEEKPKKKRKGEVVAEAENLGIQTTPDAQTIEEIEKEIEENANR